MAELTDYSAESIQKITIDESVYDVVDLSRSAFKRNLEEAAIEARDFARTLVTNILPDPISYVIYYGCSYDGNPLIGDQKTFPEDYENEPLTTAASEEATQCLWREGFVPEWIDVQVSHEDGEQTYVTLSCCGRYSATSRNMYHVREGRPPFHVLGPSMPSNINHKQGEKFDLYWQKNLRKY
jgi:hypothetical protein